MNEREKMIAGLPYDAFMDKALLDDRINAKDLCFKYNSLAPSEKNKRNEIIKKLFAKTSEHFHIESNFYCDYGYNIEIGKNFYMNHNCTILDCAKVIFGDNVFIGPNCGIYTAIHPYDAETRNSGIEKAKPITLGNNIWIGGGVTILPGVIIGDNTIIGAGSVVTKSIPANVIAVGNPCKIIREITEKDKTNF